LNARKLSSGSVLEKLVIIDLPAIDPTQAVLGGRLRRVREARGFALHRLAAEAGLASARLALAEQGRTRLTSTELHVLIGALRISLSLLYGENGAPPLGEPSQSD
jgi:transcriptional regulator with XRE-family HTH domain